MKIKILIIMLVLCAGLVSAIEIYQVNQPVNLQFTCTLNNEIPDSANYNITISDPVGNVVVSNAEAGSQGNGAFNYTYEFGRLGIYKIKQFCYSGDYSYSSSDYIEITGMGNTQDSGLTQSALFVAVALILSLFIWIKISKFFGSIMIMILGFGVLFMISVNGWIGWIIISCGFIATLYALLAPPKKSKKYRR